MSKYKILSTNPVTDTHEFFVDTVNDLKILPKETASIAYVVNTGEIYICNNAGEWINFAIGNQE